MILAGIRAMQTLSASVESLFCDSTEISNSISELLATILLQQL